MFMKRVIVVLVLFVSVFGLFLLNKPEHSDSSVDVSNDDTSAFLSNNLVNGNGWLGISGNRLVNESGEYFRLKGMSTHGIQWYGDFANEEMMTKLRDEWGSNLFRIAMYTNEQGYIQNRGLEDKVVNIVDMAIRLDMYVIIDWHILSDNNPNMYINEAKDFFDRMSDRYKDYPNVIYEICNEPNGGVTWSGDIKPYANQVLKVIRRNSPKSIVIVGTPTWSQDVDKVLDDPIDDERVMYAFHFYAGTAIDSLMSKVNSVVDKIPIFVSEWGISDATGTGGVFIDEANRWMDFMDQYNISWANWSLSNKDESSALLLPGAPINTLDDMFLSESGKFVKDVIRVED